jgi:hypothetical protein
MYHYMAIRLARIRTPLDMQTKLELVVVLVAL